MTVEQINMMNNGKNIVQQQPAIANWMQQITDLVWVITNTQQNMSYYGLLKITLNSLNLYVL